MAGGAVYRVANEALRDRAEDLWFVALAREARIRPRLRASLPDAVRARLDALRRGARRARTAVDLEAALIAYCEALDEVIALAPTIEAELLALDDEPAHPAPDRRRASRPQPRGRALPPLGVELARILRHRDPSAVVEPLGARAQRARFRVGGVPFAAVAELRPDARDLDEVAFAVATSVRRGTPPLRLGPEGFWHGVGKALRIQHDLEVGDPSFDDLFLVEGTGESIRLLGREARAALMRLARFDVPRLLVEAGAATVRWCFEPAGAAVDAAVALLAAVRSVPCRISLVDIDDD